MTKQPKLLLTTHRADTEQPEKQPTSCNLVSGNPDPDEPVIEIPFRTESSGKVFKLQVSMTDFCKLPIREVVKLDGMRHHLIEVNNQPPLDKEMILHKNTSSSPQISSSTNGDGVVNLIKSTCNLPMQVGVDNAGNIRRDFPFDGKMLTMREKKALSITTLVASSITCAAATTTKKDAADTSTSSTDTSTKGSHVFSITVAQCLAANMADIVIKTGKFSEDLFSDSEQKMFPTDNSTVGSDTTNEKVVTDGDNDGTEEVVATQRSSTSDPNEVTDMMNTTTEDTDEVTKTNINKSEVTNTTATTNEDPSEEQSEVDNEVVDTNIADPSDEISTNNKDTVEETTTQSDEPGEGDGNLSGPAEVSVETTKDDEESGGPSEVKPDTNTHADRDTVVMTTSGNNPTAHKDTSTLGGSGCGDTRTKNTITIVVNSNMQGVIKKVSNNFNEYQKRMKLPGIDIKLHPIVKLTYLDTGVPDFVKKGETTSALSVGSDAPPEPTPTPSGPVVVNGSTQTPEQPNLMDSVIQDVETCKKVKVYLDEDLALKQFHMKQVKEPSPTKGKELSEYHKYLF